MSGGTSRAKRTTSPCRSGAIASGMPAMSAIAAEVQAIQRASAPRFSACTSSRAAISATAG
jgi:hypothetical protein